MRRRAVKINRAQEYAYDRRTMLAEPPVLVASAQARVGPARRTQAGEDHL